MVVMATGWVVVVRTHYAGAVVRLEVGAVVILLSDSEIGVLSIVKLLHLTPKYKFCQLLSYFCRTPKFKFCELLS